jgi:hypothetical protein
MLLLMRLPCVEDYSHDDHLGSGARAGNVTV